MGIGPLCRCEDHASEKHVPELHLSVSNQPPPRELCQVNEKQAQADLRQDEEQLALGADELRTAQANVQQAAQELRTAQQDVRRLETAIPKVSVKWPSESTPQDGEACAWHMQCDSLPSGPLLCRQRWRHPLLWHRQLTWSRGCQSSIRQPSKIRRTASALAISKRILPSLRRRWQSCRSVLGLLRMPWQLVYRLHNPLPCH